MVIALFDAKGQVIPPPLIFNAAGHSYPGLNDVFVTDNIGEPCIQTLGPSGNLIVTQGFLQPFWGRLSFVGDVQHNDVSCKDRNDGSITVNLANLPADAEIMYSWTPQNICPSNTCSTLNNLPAGNYTIHLLVNYTLAARPFSDSSTKIGVTIQDINGPCRITLYNAVTPNGDKVNDVWQIDNIDEFPNNEVQIYNRWGQKIFEAKGYNNQSISWPTMAEADKLFAGTYFYVLTLGDGSPPYKGWIEILKQQ
jgi:gliding motility-associated-like protein